MLSGIVPQCIIRDVCARVEKAKQETNEAHSLYWESPAEVRLKSRNCFLFSVKPANFPPEVISCSERVGQTRHAIEALVNRNKSLDKG